MMTADSSEKMAHLKDKIKGIKVAMLTTLGPDGVLRSRPMATLDSGLESNGGIWFFSRRDTEKIESIEAETHVNLSYADIDHQTYVSIAGRAQVIDDKEKMQELWTPILKAWFPKGLSDPSLALIKVSPESAEIWDSPSSTMVHLAGLAKSFVTGKPYDKGQSSEKLELDRH